MTPTRSKPRLDVLGRQYLRILCGAGSCPEFFGDWDPDRCTLRLAQTYEFVGVGDGANVYAPTRSPLPRTKRVWDQLASLRPRYVRSDSQRPPVFKCGRCGRPSYLSVPQTIAVEAVAM